MSNPGARFCPYCGQQVTTADATFCERCGRALPGSTAPDPGYVPQLGTGDAISDDRTAASFSSAPVVVNTPTKSTGIAVLLEFFIPGAGAMYLERVGMGAVWLAGTVVGGAIAIVIYSAILQSEIVGASSVVAADCYDTSGSHCSGVGETIIIGIVVFICLIVGWLILRCVLVSRYALMYNRRLQA